MANRNDKDNTGRTVAIVGGGALLLLLLLRGKGWGLGGGDDQGDGGHGAGTSSDSRATTSGTAAPRAPCRVRVDAEGIQVDGTRADLATTTDRCRAAGSAEIHATGASITGVIADVVDALQAAGVQVWAAPDVWSASHSVPVRRPR